MPPLQGWKTRLLPTDVRGGNFVRDDPSPYLSRTGETPAPTFRLLLLFCCRLFFAVTGFHGGSEALQHGLRFFGVRAGGLQFEIFLECFGGAWGGDHFVALQRGGSDQVCTLPIISVRAIGVGSDCFIESLGCGFAHLLIILGVGVG